MKKHILITAFFLGLTAHAQLRTPAQSPSASIKQSIGLTEVEIYYSRPSTRGRAIFGALLPYNEFWRVGANAATKISFSQAVSIEGQLLKKGNYTILCKPGAASWELFWYVYESTDWNSYVTKTPVLELTLPVHQRKTHLETLELHFQEVTLDSAILFLGWEQISLEIALQVNEKEKILKAIAKTLSGPDSFDYYFAALYLHEKQMELHTALQYIQKVTTSDTALFFQVTREALILQDLGKTKEAAVVAERGLILSRKAGNKDFERMNLKIINH